MIDPVKFKKILITTLKILIVLELIGALGDAFGGKGLSRLGTDLLVAGVLYVLWDRIRVVVRDKKETYLKRMQASTENIKLWDAFVFSLLWSEEIIKEIPPDRRRQVVIAYTLILFGLLAAFLNLGSGLMPLVLSGALVLAAVNLLSWALSRERGEKESLMTELKLAHDVQVSLMPKEPPQVEGFDIAGISIPASEVGGDHFDFTHLDGDDARCAVSVFDVSGKGMQAAMSAVFTSGAFSSEARSSVVPSEILTRLNRSVYAHTKRGHFVAFLLTVLDVHSRSVMFANAGQTPPLLKTGSEIRWLGNGRGNFPLGMVESATYPDECAQLHSGDIVFLLTDGFTEAMTGQREQYGADRLQAYISQLDTDRMPAREIVNHVAYEVRSFAGDAPQHDDMTMVVVKVM